MAPDRAGAWGAFGDRSVVAPGNRGTIVTGDVHLPADAFEPPEGVAAPPGTHNLDRAGPPVEFVGREAELARLAAALAPGSEGAACAVHGLGGVGKSALARAFALGERDAGRHDPVWWVRADTPESVTAGLAALTDRLRLAHRHAGVSVAQRAEWAVGWLQSHTGWLLVLDDVEEPGDVDWVLAALDRGHHLITTRRGDAWRPPTETLALAPLPLPAAVDLLARVTGSPPDAPGTPELADELGRLPLALQQAGAYLREQETEPLAYLELLRDEPALTYATGPLGGDHERTVTRVWHHSLRAVDERDPRATHLLRVLAWFGPDGVPRDLFAHLREDGSRPPTGAGRRLLTLAGPGRWRRWLRRTGRVRARRRAPHRVLPPRAVDRALALLRAYSMISLNRSSVSVHPLVQAVARTPDAADPPRAPRAVTAARREATELLLHEVAAHPAVVENWARWEVTLPHVEAFLRASPPELDGPETAVLLDHAATQLLTDPRHGAARAVGYAERLLAARRRHLVGGRRHPAYANGRALLAWALATAGQLDRATALLEERAPHGSLTGLTGLTGRGNARVAMRGQAALGHRYLERGEPHRAVPLFRALHEDAAERHGPRHRVTLEAANNLAGALGEAGEPERAVALLEETLAASRAELGALHPHTLLVRHNLADAYALSGDVERGVDLHERTLDDRLRAFGPRHPQVLVSRASLAVACEEAGQPARAAALLTENLAAVGEHGPRADGPVPVWEAHLARVLLAAGETERATALFRENLPRLAASLGPRHPDLVWVRLRFARAWLEREAPAEAIPPTEEALALAEDAFGRHHRLTVTARNQLGVACLGAGAAGRAVELFERALAEARQTAHLGEEFGFVLRSNRAQAYRETGDAERAARQLETVAAEAAEALGEPHPVTLDVRSALARSLAAAGQRARGRALLTAVLAEAERTLGQNSPEARRFRGHLDRLGAAADEPGPTADEPGPVPGGPGPTTGQPGRAAGPGPAGGAGSAAAEPGEDQGQQGD